MALKSERIEAGLQPLMAEARVALLGVNFCLQLGYAHVVIEGDSLKIVQMVKDGSSGLSLLDLVVDDIRHLADRFEAVLISHVKRGGNVVAH